MVSIAHSLAFPQGMFHTVTSELLVVVNEGEGQGDVQGVGPVGSCRPLARLKRDHQIHPGCRALDFELLDEILPKYFTQQLFELIVHT